MQVIHPYKLKTGGWVFDDPEKSLVQEGLVAGIDTMLDDIAAEFGIDPEVGFDVGFSDKPIENAEVILTKVREIDGQPELFGTDYMDASGMTGWLCPNLLQYFTKPPEKIYCKVML